MITTTHILPHFSTDLHSGFFPSDSRSSDLLFFDIETTGLSPKTSRVFLIGFIHQTDEDSLPRLIQFFSESDEDSEEKAVLEAFLSYVKSAKYLIHFNGSSFDVPFLTQRCKAHGLEHPFSSILQIDLYRRLMNFPAFFRQMENHRQKSFESVVQYPRKDALSGKEMIKLYHNYLKNGNPELLKLLLLHNFDDMKGMISILPLGALEQLLLDDYQFCSAEEISEYNIDGILERKLLFSFTLKQPVPARLSASSSFCYITVLNNTLKIKMPLYEGTLKYFYQDYKNYYYLPYEDEAVHKSVGIYLEQARRQKAKASNCYKKISGTFLPAPGCPLVAILKEEYLSKEQYTLWPFEDNSPTAFQSYIHEILKTAITEK